MRHPVLLAASAFLLLGVGFGACKLDLDESLIPRDGGPDSSSGGIGGGGFGGSFGGGGSGGGNPDAAACDADPQCAVDGGGCLEGMCTAGKCDYQICPAPSACEGRACNATTNTCGTPKPVSFAATTIDLASPVGCSGSLSSCLAAFEDYVFVATSDGVLHAWRITDPANPFSMTVDSPIFPVAGMVATAGRLLLMSALQAGKVQLAWVDLPTDPLSATLTLGSAGVNVPGGLTAGYPSSFAGFLLVDGTTNLFPSTYVEPPVQNNSTLAQNSLTGIDSNAAVVASSTSRLLSFWVDVSSVPQTPIFSLVAKAGTTDAQAGSPVSPSYEASGVLSTQYFSSTRDGSVLWTTNRVDRDDAGIASSSAVVLRWLLAEGSDTIDGAPEIDIATYSQGGINANRAGRAALIDSSMALVTTANPADTTQTLVRAVQKSGTSLTLQSGSTPLPFGVSEIGVSATRKFGVVLTPDTLTGLNATLHVFAPSCD